MPATQAKPAEARAISPASSRWRTWGLRLFWIVVVSVVIGFLFRQSARMANADPAPAGFARGLVHGALMPIALPNLLVGNDVTIYAANNTGLRYKLGYTCGVNGCGAIFFGLLYWRLHRLRRANPPPR